MYCINFWGLYDTILEMTLTDSNASDKINGRPTPHQSGMFLHVESNNHAFRMICV